MPFNPRVLSPTFDVAPLGDADVDAVFALARGNPDYFARMGDPVTAAAIRADMTALPPGKTAADKFYVGFRRDGRLAAVLDLVLGYPDAATAWIGFLMTDAALQNSGVGTAIARGILGAMRDAGFTRVGLGVVVGNDGAARFWQRNGFVPDGEARDMSAYSVVRMFRAL